MNETTGMALNDTIKQGHEPDVVNSRLMILSSIGFVLVMVLGLLVTYAVLQFLGREKPGVTDQISTIERSHTFAGPEFTDDQTQQLGKLREAERQQLGSYEWIDKKAGIARIPIQRALEIEAKQGFVVEKPNTGSKENDKQTQ